MRVSFQANRRCWSLLRLSHHYDSRDTAEFQVSPLATEEEITTTHSPQYVQKVVTGDLTERELRNVGFPWSEANVKRSLSSVGGTVAAATFVCEETEKLQQLGAQFIAPWGAHVAGGTHHAFYDFGEGFCVFSGRPCTSRW